MSTNTTPDTTPPPAPASQAAEAPPAGETPATAAPPAPDWTAWQAAGLDPSQNPYDVRQALDLAGRLQSDDLRAPTIEALARQAGLLPDGIRMHDLLQAAEALRAQQEDPFAQYAGEPDPAAQPAFDPRQLREVWQQDMATALTQAREQWQQETAQQMAQAAFDQASRDIAQQHALQPQALEVVRTLAVQGLTLNPNMTHEQALSAAYQQLQAITTAGVASAVQQAASAPQTGVPASPGPGAPRAKTWADAEALWNNQTSVGG